MFHICSHKRFVEKTKELNPNAILLIVNDGDQIKNLVEPIKKQAQEQKVALHVVVMGNGEPSNLRKRVPDSNLVRDVLIFLERYKQSPSFLICDQRGKGLAVTFALALELLRGNAAKKAVNNVKPIAKCDPSAYLCRMIDATIRMDMTSAVQSFWTLHDTRANLTGVVADILKQEAIDAEAVAKEKEQKAIQQKAADEQKAKSTKKKPQKKSDAKPQNDSTSAKSDSKEETAPAPSNESAS